MRSQKSLGRLFHAVKAGVRSTLSPSRARDVAPSCAVLEGLESRRLFTAAADIRIPVLTYHELIDNASADPVANASNTVFANFKTQMDWLNTQGFSTLSLNTLKAWLASPVATGVTVPGTSVT